MEASSLTCAARGGLQPGNADDQGQPRSTERTSAGDHNSHQRFSAAQAGAGSSVVELSTDDRSADRRGDRTPAGVELPIHI